MIRLRAFHNDDPPALADLWNRGLPDRGVVRPLTAHEFDSAIVSKIDFEAAGLILAEDGGQLVGFVHAGLGPISTSGDDLAMGTIAMLVVDPDRDDPEFATALIVEAEGYLERRGAKVVYAGGQAELCSFYWGLYGGSETSGILENHESFHRAVVSRTFEPVASTVILEADLAGPEFRDPKGVMIRRQTRVEIVEDAMPANPRESTAIGETQITRFRVFAKSTDKELARASLWDMAAFGRVDGKARTGLFDVEVVEDERRKGFGRFLIGEVLRHCRGQWGELVSVQTRSTNEPALALYESIGFNPVDTSTLYRRPGSRSG